MLLSADIGEGLFFAGQSHVAIKVIAAPFEHEIITSNPIEIMNMQKAQPVPTATITETTVKTEPYVTQEPINSSVQPENKPEVQPSPTQQAPIQNTDQPNVSQPIPEQPVVKPPPQDTNQSIPPTQ